MYDVLMIMKADQEYKLKLMLLIYGEMYDALMIMKAGPKI
jgi:hypothetical protein